MKTLLKLEELMMFALGLYLFSLLDFNWWWFVGLLLAPDIGALGYLVNPKIGGIGYNVFHHKGLAILIYLIGIYYNLEVLKLIGVILFSHASIDRVFGYGFKYLDNFKRTHLEKLGD
ncbi:DUF4260 domain-containing protein [Winogradskyella eckloniae]|uniref:DUF4260 domain-containing protein n=1 Tax=Winogradskyella eckloniae TaxID=1089306 RepID=UPI0015678255|nr:DUF4260 domain-containing protein [Winogradskyella eckloniae]NRD19194.1 DUF4260 domain-containing protein [Winogradskyella eckloniae]